MKLIIFMMLVALIPVNLFAQDGADKPLEITADRTLEWHRQDKQFIAVGSVQAVQGGSVLYADRLTADYRETADSSMDIYQLTATGNVRLENNDGSTAYGEKAVYTVDDGRAVLTGANLRIVSPDRTITASDRMEYLTQKGEASAHGNAKMVQGDDTITAGTLKAFFTQGEGGQRALSRAEAIGNVVIITPQEKLTGDKGVYTAANDTAEVTGKVRITRGPNVLEGARATVNLKTSVSTMYGGASSPTGDTRVRGVFYPEKKSE